MLEHLFGSRTRVKLLNLFLRHPDEPIFVREITRRIDTQINAVRRELANLVRFGILVEEVTLVDGSKDGANGTGASAGKGAKKKYYKTNRRFPLLAEMTSLIVKAQILLEHRLDHEIMKIGDVRYLAFLGPFVGAPKAPVDLFIVGQVGKSDLERLLEDTEQEFGFEVNFSVMTPEEYRYRKDITDRFLYAILEAPKHVMIDKLEDPKP